MLEIICRRRRVRDFLGLYSPEKWKKIIPDLCEIAILNLQTSFGTSKFLREDLVDIILELENPSIDNMRMQKKLQKIPPTNKRKNPQTQDYQQNFTMNPIQPNPMPFNNMQPYINRPNSGININQPFQYYEPPDRTKPFYNYNEFYNYRKYYNKHENETKPEIFQNREMGRTAIKEKFIKIPYGDIEADNEKNKSTYKNARSKDFDKIRSDKSKYESEHPNRQKSAKK